eukprot:tig00021374_g21126.t1
MGVGSSVSSWGSAEACSAAVTGTALSNLALDRKAELQDYLDVCSAPGATHFSSVKTKLSGTTKACEPCKALSKVQTYSAPDCASSGPALYSKVFEGELTNQALADSCGASGAAYYASTKGTNGGSEVTCTKCPAVTAVYSYSSAAASWKPAVCSPTSVAAVKYHYGALPAGSPELSADVACDPEDSHAFAAKGLNGGTSTACAHCPARSIVTAYPWDNCEAAGAAYTAARAEKQAGVDKLMSKGPEPLLLEDVEVLQNAQLAVDALTREFGAQARQLDDFKDPWLNLQGVLSAGRLTEGEGKELVRLASDLADETDGSARVSSFDGTGWAEQAAAMEAACQNLYTEFQGWWGGQTGLLSAARYQSFPFKSVSVSKGTWCADGSRAYYVVVRARPPHAH